MTEEDKQWDITSRGLTTFRKGIEANNFVEFPIALLTDSAPKGQKTIESQDVFTDWKTGEVFTRRVCVTGSEKFGLPTAKDDEVLFALLQLSKLAKFANPEVWFNSHNVIELLEWENRGWAYDRIEESMHRWKGVSIHYWNAWRNHKNGTWTDTEAIGVIQYFKIVDGRRGKRKGVASPLSRFLWNSVLFESFQSGYLKSLDFELWRRLQKPASKRAYRFLDKQFYYGPKLEYDVRVLACDKLGFSRNYDIGQLKDKLRPMWDELGENDYLESVHYRKERPAQWTVVIEQKAAKTIHLPDSAVSSASSDLVPQLIMRGIEGGIARDLVTHHNPEIIREKLAFFDWLVMRRDRRVSTNPPGFLVAAISQNYALPRDYARTIRQGDHAAERSRQQRTSNRESKATVVARAQRNVSENCDNVVVEEDRLKQWIAGQHEEELAVRETEALEAGFGSELERKIILDERRKGIPVRSGGRIRQAYVRRYSESTATTIVCTSD